jgi:hypothetical protein
MLTIEFGTIQYVDIGTNSMFEIHPLLKQDVHKNTNKVDR